MKTNERITAMEKNTDKVLPIVIASIPVYVLSNCLNNLDNPISICTLSVIVMLIACYLWIERKIMDTENIIDNLASNRNAGNDYSIIVIQRETEKRKLMLDKYIKTKGWVVGTIFFIVFFYILLKIFYS